MFIVVFLVSGFWFQVSSFKFQVSMATCAELLPEPVEGQSKYAVSG